jgi:DNA-binding NarL/FixJ family response regulator
LIKISIPESKEKILKQITALEHLINQDASEKDKNIHGQALEALKEGLKALEQAEQTKGKGGRPKKAPTEKILELRHKGMTQEQIARELNLSISTIVRQLRKEEHK